MLVVSLAHCVASGIGVSGCWLSTPGSVTAGTPGRGITLFGTPGRMVSAVGTPGPSTAVAGTPGPVIVASGLVSVGCCIPGGGGGRLLDGGMVRLGLVGLNKSDHVCWVLLLCGLGTWAGFITYLSVWCWRGLAGWMIATPSE